MVEPLADGGFALEAIEEDGIGFHVGVGNLEGHAAAVARIGGAVNGGHPAARHLRIDAVRIELLSRFQGVVKSHARRGSNSYGCFYCIGG